MPRGHAWDEKKGFHNMVRQGKRRSAVERRRAPLASAEALERRTLLSTGTIHLINDTDVFIPDDPAGVGIVSSSIDTSGAPANAVITGVTIHYQISHPYIGDLRVWARTVEDGFASDQILWNNEGGNGDNIDETEADLHRWDGLSPNRTWSLMADDQAAQDEGYIDSFEIFVNWSAPDNGPNLAPYKPPTWSNAIVTSTAAGTNIDNSPIYDDQEIFVDWALINNGSEATVDPFVSTLYVDGTLRNTWTANPPVNPDGSWQEAIDYNIGALSAGQHTIRLVVDSDDDVTEGNETDNEYIRNFTVTSSTGSISGVTWDDRNSNGTVDAGEPVLSGVIVYLDADNDGTLDAGETQTTSDATGAYTFTNLRAGNYSVRQVVPTGWEQTYPGATSTASWVTAGPTGITGGQVEGMTAQSNPVSGAVHALAAHPTNADILYLGAVNGGVWKTTNATAANPTWTPLTDEMRSLSIGAIDIDPTDPTGNTLVAGVGRFSSYANDGGARAGAYRTTDGGATWTPLTGGLAGKNISGVAARGNIIVASANFADVFTFGNFGVFRSTNGGVNFSLISGNGPGSAPNGLPGGRVFDLAGDPTNPATLYCAVRDAGSLNGIYKSVNTGQTWARVSSAAMNALNTDSDPNNTSNIEIAVGNAGQVFVGIMGSNGRLTGLFRSPDGSTAWTRLDTPVTNENGTLVGIQPRAKTYDIAGGQGQIHFSIVADPVDTNIVYVGGDRQPGPGEGPLNWPNSIGAANYSGRLFRVNAGLALGQQATVLTHNRATNNSSPHADSRDMVFDAAGNLIEGDDGGIYKRSNPRAVGPWTSLIGNLQLTEIHSLDYDHNSNRILAGTQDVGQIRSGGTGTTWTTVAQGDGAVSQVDDSNAAFSLHYYSYVGLQIFSRATVNLAGVTTAVSPVGLSVSGTGLNLIQYDPTRQFYNPYVLNTVAPARMAIGTSRIYVSLNRGDTLTELANLGRPVGAMAYGGRQGGVNNLDVLYVGAGDNIYFRSTAVGAPAERPSYPGGVVRDIVLDPENWATAYVLDATRIYRTTDSGLTWTNVTGSLGATDLRTIDFFPSTSGPRLLVGGSTGVFSGLVSTPGTWVELGANLPNAVVMDLRYDATDDVLVAGMLGRGAWMVSNLSQRFGSGVGDRHLVVLNGENISGRNFGSHRANQAPSVASLADAPDPALPGADVTLTAGGVSDPDGSVASVRFFRETNATAGLQIGAGGDSLLGTDSSDAGGWTWTFSTTGLSVGAYTYYAVATDNQGLAGQAASTTNAVRAANVAPVVGSLTLNPDPVTPNGTLTLTAGGVSDPDGTVVSVAFYVDANGDGIPDAGELLGTDTNGDDGWSATANVTWPAGTYGYFAYATDDGTPVLQSQPGTAVGTVAASGVVGRYVFYNNSSLDGLSPALEAADDRAIAADKVALLPGQTPSFANVTSFSRGLNGFFIDVAGMAPGAVLTPLDFAFNIRRAGSSPAWFSIGDIPAITTRPGEGVGGSARITITWPDNLLRNAWVNIVMLPNILTGLSASDVFYFGNLVGDTGGAGLPRVDAADLTRTFAAVSTSDPAMVSRFDINRDGLLNIHDARLVRANQRRAIPHFAERPLGEAEGIFNETPIAPVRTPTRPARRDSLTRDFFAYAPRR